MGGLVSGLGSRLDYRSSELSVTCYPFCEQSECKEDSRGHCRATGRLERGEANPTVVKERIRGAFGIPSDSALDAIAKPVSY